MSKRIGLTLVAVVIMAALQLRRDPRRSSAEGPAYFVLREEGAARVPDATSDVWWKGRPRPASKIEVTYVPTLTPEDIASAHAALRTDGQHHAAVLHLLITGNATNADKLMLTTLPRHRVLGQLRERFEERGAGTTVLVYDREATPSGARGGDGAPTWLQDAAVVWHVGLDDEHSWMESPSDHLRLHAPR